MRLTNKSGRWDTDETYVGKKKNCTVTIIFSHKNFMRNEEYWYFLINNKDKKISFNSLWENLRFKTKEECVAACESKIDELLNAKKE